jgi:hypothetical protein
MAFLPLLFFTLIPVFTAQTATVAADGEFPSQRAVAVSPKGDLVSLGAGQEVNPLNPKP